MRSVRFYQTRRGKAPLIDWLETIRNKTTLAHINQRIRRLSIGQRGDYKRVGKGVFELRIHYGAGYRVYFGEHRKNTVVLLIGGDKNSQKRDIERANLYWQDYKEQYHEK